MGGKGACSWVTHPALDQPKKGRSGGNPCAPVLVETHTVVNRYPMFATLLFAAQKKSAMETPRRSTRLAEVAHLKSNEAMKLEDEFEVAHMASSGRDPENTLLGTMKEQLACPTATPRVSSKRRNNKRGMSIKVSSNKKRATGGIRNYAKSTMIDLEIVEDIRTSSSPQSNESDITVDASELLEMEASTHISSVSLQKSRGLSESLNDKVTDSNMFEKACLLAASDYKACALRLIELAQGNLEAMVEFATILISGPVGLVGSRRGLRASAVLLLDKVLEEEDGHTTALCVKGEMLLPRQLFGTGPSQTPYSVIEEAYAYFCKADLLGSGEGRFLRGRWLVTMSPVHKNSKKTREGMRYVEEAAAAGHARALVFMAQVLEFPGKFGWGEGPPSEADLEKAVELYRKAAELGNAGALNDLGSSYATGFGGLPYDFDEAVRCYARSIKAGGLMAFENLGTHYETGMTGEAPDRVDFEKALYYYKQGAKLRCAKCAYNIAAAFAEGLGNVVQRDSDIHERYLQYCILLAEDDNDDAMLEMVSKKLVAFHMFQIVTNEPGSEIVIKTLDKLRKWMNDRVMKVTMDHLHNCLAYAVKNNDPIECHALLGSTNGRIAFKVAIELAEESNREDGDLDDKTQQRLKHVFGNYVDIVLGNCIRERRLKRRRVVVEQQLFSHSESAKK